MGKQSDPVPTETKTENGDTVVPMEVSNEEYQDLVSQAKELTVEDAQLEWMESCRYGDVDIVRALAENFPSSQSELLEYADSTTGNTGLHMASANGHTNIVKLLVHQYGHGFTKNKSGNTPLHWAAANGHASVVEFWTSQSIVEVDVLEKNNFGRSALTEGFSSQKEDVVKFLLEHDSSSEEKLLSTGGNNGQNGEEDEQLDSHIHDFFDKERPLRIRELAMKNADNPFADTDRPDQDTTGLRYEFVQVCVQ